MLRLSDRERGRRPVCAEEKSSCALQSRTVDAIASSLLGKPEPSPSTLGHSAAL